MKRVKIKDEKYLSAESIVHSRVRLSNILDKLLLKTETNSITATIDNKVILSQEYVTLNLVETKRNGNKLSIVDGKIKIGAGVSKIKVSATLFFEDLLYTKTSYIWTDISNNNTRVSSAIKSAAYAGEFESVNINKDDLDVVEGDLISVVCNNPGYSVQDPTSIRVGETNTWITVKVIG